MLLIFFIVHGFVVNSAVLLCGFKQTKGKRYENSDSLDRAAAGIGHSVCVNHLCPVVAGGGGMTKDAVMTQKTQKVLRRALRVLQIAEHLEATEAPQIDRLKFWDVHGYNAMVNLKFALSECEKTQVERSLPGQPMNQAVMDEIVEYAHSMYLNCHYKNFDEALIRETELEHGIGDRND